LNGTIHLETRGETSLFLMGLPFKNLVTHGVANGSHVELRVAPGAS
jgi:hypothetical protein